MKKKVKSKPVKKAIEVTFKPSIKAKELIRKLEDYEKNLREKCDLCRKEKDGQFLDFGNDMVVFRCNDCFKKNQTLRNYQPCEVYSRVVGYLRPVQEWNVGKKQEYKERKEYNQ